MAVDILTGTLHDALNHPDKRLLGPPAQGQHALILICSFKLFILGAFAPQSWLTNAYYLTDSDNVLSRYLSPHLEVQRPRPELKELKAIGSNTGPCTQPA